MHSFLSFGLRCDMLQLKRLLVMEEFENERLSKIVPAVFGKMGFKSTLDSPTWTLAKATVKKRRRLQFGKMLVHVEWTAVRLLSGFFSRYVSLLNTHVYNVNSALYYSILDVWVCFFSFGRKWFSYQTKLTGTVPLICILLNITTTMPDVVSLVQ